MPIDIEDNIANLRIKIAEQEREIIILEGDCIALENELADFEARYNQLIKPLVTQIEAAKSVLNQLRDLQLMQQMGEDLSVESLWRGQKSERYIPPHEAKFAIPEPILHKRETKNIKTLYRQLARQYHPDLAKDEADRERRTKIMSLINTAYQSDDIESLRALDETIAEKQGEVLNSQVSLNTMLLRQLQQQSHDLAVEIRDLKERRHNLKYGSLMELKLDESIARAKGENMLEDLADEMQVDYWRIMREIDDLRQQVN